MIEKSSAMFPEKVIWEIPDDEADNS